MTIINYDLDNEEQLKLIDDYVFFKYYAKIFYNDWKLHYHANIDKIGTYGTFKIIKQHQNKLEFNRFCEIYKQLVQFEYNDNDLYISTNTLIIDFFQRGYYDVKYNYKQYLYYQFKPIKDDDKPIFLMKKY